MIGRWAKKAEGKKALEGHVHLFLRNQEDLTAEEEQVRATLAQAFLEINIAWQLKEALRTWYATTSAATAANELDIWVATVKRDGPAELRKALSAIRLSNGFVEGKNNRTKALMRQGYGYRNRLHLRLRILMAAAV